MYSKKLGTSIENAIIKNQNDIKRLSEFVTNDKAEGIPEQGIYSNNLTLDFIDLGINGSDFESSLQITSYFNWVYDNNFYCLIKEDNVAKLAKVNLDTKELTKTTIGGALSSLALSEYSNYYSYPSSRGTVFLYKTDASALYEYDFINNTSVSINVTGIDSSYKLICTDDDKTLYLCKDYNNIKKYSGGSLVDANLDLASYIESDYTFDKINGKFYMFQIYGNEIFLFYRDTKYIYKYKCINTDAKYIEFEYKFPKPSDSIVISQQGFMNGSLEEVHSNKLILNDFKNNEFIIYLRNGKTDFYPVGDYRGCIVAPYNGAYVNYTNLNLLKPRNITYDNFATKQYVDDAISLPDYTNKYDNPYKNKGSVVVKMQTHCHTTNSDGDGTLEQVINAYKSKGFNAICITDHNMVTDTSAYNTDDFITILGTEHAVSLLGSLTANHMNVINTNYLSEKETPFEVYQDYKSNKSFTVKNHPHDLINPNYEVSYDNGDYLCDAIEIFNGKRQTGYLYAFWRAIETGHKIKHVATDDFHEASTSITANMTSSGNAIEIPTITGWIKLYCKEFSEQGIMDALFKGSYISCIEHDMDIESGNDYIRATTEIPSDFRFVDKNGLVLKEEKNVMTSQYVFNGFEELIMVISQPVDNPTKYAISQCVFNNDVFGKEHKQVINDKMLCEKIITDKFTPKYHMINNDAYNDYPFLHIKNLELYGKTIVDYTNRTFKHSRAIMAFNDNYLTLSSELLKQGDYIKDGYLYINTDEIAIDGTWNMEFYKTYTNVNQFRIEIQDKFFKPRGDRIFICNYAPRIIEYGSGNPVVGLYLNTSSAPRYITIQLDKNEFPNVDTLKAKLNETPLRILYSTFEPKVKKLQKEYYIDTLEADEINVLTEASAFSFDMIHNKDINAPEYGPVSNLSMTLVPGEFAYDGTGDGISMNIDGTDYTLSEYNMYPYDYIKDNVIYKCTKVFDYNDIAVVTKLNSTNYFRVQFPADTTPDFIDSMVVGNEAMSVKKTPFTNNGTGIFLYIYYADVPPYTKTNFPTLANLKALFAEKYPDFKVYLKYKDAIGTENITLPEASITKDSIITMNDKYSSSLFKVN